MSVQEASTKGRTRKVSLAGALTRTLFLGLLFVFILLAVFLKIYGSTVLRNITDERLDYIATTQADNAAQLLWDFETEKMQTALKNIVEDKNIKGAQILELVGEFESEVVQFGWDGNAALDPGQSILMRDILYVNDQGQSRKLGVLKILVDYRSVEEQIRTILWGAAFLLAAVFLPMGVVMYYVLRREINPITQLSDSLVNADYFTHKIEEPQSRSREIHDLFDALITMQRIMQEQTLEIRAQKVMLDTIVEKMPLGMGVARVSNQNIMVVVNDRYKSLFGLEGQDVIERTVSQIHTAEDAAFFAEMDSYVLEHKVAAQEMEYHVRGQDRRFVAHILKAPILDDKGHVALIVTMVDDVTDQYYARESLIEAKNIAERASQAKSEFLANMSHELRTPMNSIMGLTNIMIEDGTASAEHHDMLKTVLKSSGILLNIVNDILDLSKIEAGGVRLETIPFDLPDTMHAVFETLRPLASSKSLVFEMEETGDHVKMVKGDPTRFARIITNLGSNAIKFTPEGKIKIEVHAEVTDDDHVHLTCRVRDTGIGIEADKLDHVFEKFSQADDTISRKFGGTGLGLAITKQLTELMGGHISVQSTVGQGSEFTVVIPFELAEHQDSQERNPQSHDKSDNVVKKPLSEIRILVAEDQKMNQMLIGKMLERLGVGHFVLADDGVIALGMYKDAQTPYDLVIMDCHMPNMTGYESSQAIRAYETEVGISSVPILAMTADAMVGTREKCLEAGMTDYISKPVNAKEFSRLLGLWFIVPEKPAA